MRRTREAASQIGDAAGRNWAPLALVGTGLAWIIAKEAVAWKRERDVPASAQSDIWEDPLQAHGIDDEEDLDDIRPVSSVEARMHGSVQEDIYEPEDIEPDDVRGTVAGTTKARARAAREALDRNFEAARSGARRNVEEAKMRMREANEKIRTGTRRQAEAARRNATEGYESAKLKSREAYGKAKVKGRQAVDAADRDLHERPLLYVGLGIIAGAAIGALLPTSRAERKAIGDKAHRARVAAEAEVRDGIERARHAVEEGLHEAKGGFKRGRKEEEGISGPH